MEHHFEADQPVSRRKLLATFGIAGVAVVSGSAMASEKETFPLNKGRYEPYQNVNEMVQDNALKEGVMVQTLGYHVAGDGGNACYRIVQKSTDPEIELRNGLSAVLVNVQSVNYKLFGAVGDGKNDDSIQIKSAHIYANKIGVPVHNYTGEYWLTNPCSIEISTNVDWGNTIFHINEANNTPGDSRFKILPARTAKTIDLNSEQKKALLSKLRPGVKLITELKDYANCLVSISDNNDRIGFRAGASFEGQSWAREELFYVEEHGRITTDIAWEFKNYTQLTAYAVDTAYLTVSGGTFYLSGDSPGTRYVRNGFHIARSRTIIQNQWVGLEPGKADVSMSPRSGFYFFNNVYDVKLENIRLIPYEQDREAKDKDVSAGTYGIGGSRILNALFRNVTAEGGPVHWGVFGTNMNKNFRVENCRLNRIDVHFHCWNLYIKDSSIGYRGISVTGGGDLFIENSSCYSRSFINFRRDFGAKWDGDIRLRNCRFLPAVTGETTFLDFSPANFDYKYPLGFGRSIIVENLVVDFSAVPGSAGICWLMKVAAFSKTTTGQRLCFPRYIEFRNVMVQGRSKGLRLMQLADPRYYKLEKQGNYDHAFLTANSQIIFDNIQLEEPDQTAIESDGLTHFSIADSGNNRYEDNFTLYPEIKLKACQHVVAKFGNNAVSADFEKCSLSAISGTEKGTLTGSFSFTDCAFLPVLSSVRQPFYNVAATLGTSFTNCILHAPQMNGRSRPELADDYGFLQLNKRVRFNHLNTRLGNDIINYFKAKNIAFKLPFIAMLKNHHELEKETL
jgi:hypothetical protein